MSILWKHFTDEGLDKAKCNYCNAIISYKKGNRSTMRKHLERKHPETLGITTQALTEDFGTDDENNVIQLCEIHPIFQIENNIKYFIKMIHERPSLYEYSRSVGWNSKRNKLIWQQVSNTFQVDVIECQKFWKYLKETYELHRRNPKLDDHKYAKELLFLGELYKKRRQRKDDLARKRKLYKTGTNSEQLLLEEDLDSKYIEISIMEDERVDKNTLNESDKSYKIITAKQCGEMEDINDSIENPEIYEVLDYDVSTIDTSSLNAHIESTIDTSSLNAHIESIYPNEYNEDSGHEYICNDINGFIIRDDVSTNAENSFDVDASLKNVTQVISLKNASTQTETFSSSNEETSSKQKLSSECKKCLNEFDELDFLMEFIKSKIRKFPAKAMNKLQIKILNTVMEAEQASKTIN